MRIDSVCAYCGVGCDISATVQENRIKSIRARKEGTVSEGKLCIKGKDGFDFVHSPNRLKAVKIKKSFLNRNELFIPATLKKALNSYSVNPDGYIYPSLDLAYQLVAWKLSQITSRYGNFSFAAIGGARTSCESAYLFQKFTRQVIRSPHIDNCARVCHAPTLKGMRAVVGEGAATNPFSDIKEAEFIVVIGSNTTEAHPIVANKIVSAVRNGAKLAVFDVREITLSKMAEINCILPYESNLLFLNMLAYTILEEGLWDRDFVQKRTAGFDAYREEIMNDPYADPDFFLQIPGYEDLAEKIRAVARNYASKRSLILWGLGVTEHTDGSYAVSAICNLALLTGNIGKTGAGLMPLRGQNNVQGTCDMGCLPYYDPDYRTPLVEGKKTPDLIDAMLGGEIRALFNMGEDIAHVHANQNKIHKALQKLELIVVNELFDNEITRYADVVFGVKSAYEKTGVYINAERRLHLSQPLVHNDLPDDWEVLQGIAKALGHCIEYDSSKAIWREVQQKVPVRFGGADYEKLEKSRIEGLQWPIHEEETPILHINTFRTEDGMGHFRYKRYLPRNMVKELIEARRRDFYLTTGRNIAHYNNAAQTKESPRLMKKYGEDVVLGSIEDAEFFSGKTEVILISRYGRTLPLRLKLVKGLKKGTLFTTFHHAKSCINFLFGDECDELTKTARFKSIRVKIEPGKR
ncbi:MAG: formate dehydrogenase [Campylobacteraceae bacterium 4484_4]|nr:MAG: formate dehydrogenase [Campylobacteraceae bacterium 4484_4]